MTANGRTGVLCKGPARTTFREDRTHTRLGRVRGVLAAARTACRTTCSLWLTGTISDAPEPPFAPIGVNLDFLTRDKARLIDWMRKQQGLFPWMFFPRELEAACANGHLFTAIEKEKEIIGYIKVGMNKVYIHDFDRIIPLPAGVAFVYDIFVLPSYRNRQVARYALLATMRLLEDHGFTRVWCHIEKWNHASLRLFQRAGFRERGTIRFSTFFMLPLFLKDGYNPFFGWNSFLAAP